MTSTDKRFDAVGFMRAARDKLSAQIQGMTVEQEQEWLAAQKIDDPFLARLRDKAVQTLVAREGWREG